MKQKLLSMLALLAAVVTGAWATPNSIVINGTPQVGDKSISLTYYFDPANIPDLDLEYAPTLKVKCATDNKWDEMALSVNDVSSGTTTISLNTLGEFEAGKTYEVCFAYSAGNWVDEVFQSFVPAASGYSVTMKSGTEDATSWQGKAGTGNYQSLPLEGVAAGTAVTLQYNGRLKVKSVTATSDAAPAATMKTITIAADFHTGTVVATAPEMTIEYNEGEKWSDVAARYDWLKMYETYTVYYEAGGKSGDLHTADGGVKPSDLVDPNKSYYWGYE